MTNADGPLRLLLLDDEQPVLNALRRVLRKEGYDITLCSDPDSALRLVRELEIDVVVSDHLMPGMTGTEFFTLASRLHPHVTRIMLTGQADMDVAIRAINEGHVHRFLTKPWDDEQLKQVLREAAREIQLRRRATGGPRGASAGERPARAPAANSAPPRGAGDLTHLTQPGPEAWRTTTAIAGGPDTREPDAGGIVDATRLLVDAYEAQVPDDGCVGAAPTEMYADDADAIVLEPDDLAELGQDPRLTSREAPPQSALPAEGTVESPMSPPRAAHDPGT